MNYDLPTIICAILAFIPALVLHEVAHGFAAYKLGDPTAKSKGRLSLNPLKHVDPFGTVILPLCLLAMNMPMFGYAKPVPYNPAYFEDPRKGDLVVGLAGPLANLVQAVAGAAVAAALYFALPAGQLLVTSTLFYYVFLVFLPFYVMTNLCLLFFNILPIPPLDGSSIWAFFLSRKYMHIYYKIQQYAMLILIVLLVLLPAMLPQLNIIGWYMDVTAGNLFSLLYAWM